MARVNGDRGVSAQMALHLGQAFGTGPGYWMRLQDTYEEKCARVENGVVVQEPINATVRCARSLVRRYIPQDVPLVDEVIAERHEAATHE